MPPLPRQGRLVPMAPLTQARLTWTLIAAYARQGGFDWLWCKVDVQVLCCTVAASRQVGGYACYSIVRLKAAQF